MPTRAILIPFFFTSIGFSIPVTQIFHGSIVWRGIVFALLMALGKLMTGAWLIRIRNPFLALLCKLEISRFVRLVRSAATFLQRISPTPQATHCNELHSRTTSSSTPAQRPSLDQSATGDNTLISEQQTRSQSRDQKKPLSLYPAALLGSAMVTRGEIGFLIASLAESHGNFAGTSVDEKDGQPSVIYLIVIWAIMLCTLSGPIALGLLMRRVGRLQDARRQNVNNEEREGEGPLGFFGVTRAAQNRSRD